MLLSVDTSTRTVGVALYNGVRVLSEMTWVSKNHHNVELAPAVDETFNRVGITSNELQALAVAIGPGGFTGLRIGLALVKGLAFSHHLPLFGIPTLDILANAQPVDENLNLAAVLEAGRKRLAVGWYQASEDQWQSTGKLDNLTLDEFIQKIRNPTLVCGELNEAARQRLARKYKNVVLSSPAKSARRPGILAELAWDRWKSGEFDNPASLKPIYLHHGEPIPG